MTPVLKISFLTTINPNETAALGKILYILAASMEMLQMLSLILKNSVFQCIISTFLNKIVLEITTFSNFFKFFNLSVIEYKAILLQTA